MARHHVRRMAFARGGNIVDIDSLLSYIKERQVIEDCASGYSSVRGTPPSIQDTFFAMASLKMLHADSPDREIIKFISRSEYLDLNRAYYASKCLELAGCRAELKDGRRRWQYLGDAHEIVCFVPNTPLESYFEYDLYGMYGSSIFSSSLGTLLKRIELGGGEISDGIVRSSLLILGDCQDIIRAYMAFEILEAIRRRGYEVELSASHIKKLSKLLEGCKTRSGYTSNPEATIQTLESTYAGSMIARKLGHPEPEGLEIFVGSLQNENGGFRRSPFGGISALEFCYLALCILFRGRHDSI